MRTNRRLTWLIFTVCALLLVDGMGWLTWQLLRLDRSERLARQDASLQEAVRLALWRMDSMLSPILAAETSRPYFHYRAYYPATRAYNRMWEPVGQGEVVVASPLLAGPGEYIRLHFESTPEQRWLTSPQLPETFARFRLEGDAMPATQRLALETRFWELTAILRGEGATPVMGERIPDSSTAARGRDAGAPESSGEPELQLTPSEQEVRNLARQNARAGVSPTTDPQPSIGRETEDASDAEFQARVRMNDMAQTTRGAAPAGAEVGLAISDLGQAGGVATGRFTPVWRTNSDGGPELLVVRVVHANGLELLQGFWLDWPGLRESLLASVGDLLPDADLQPVMGRAQGSSLLAGVPAVLAPGSLEAPGLSGMTPTRVVLVVAWIAVIAALVAIGLVLRASLELSDRRGRFVSAVTHELRTPLTTFCLYSQMLADGLVKGEDKRAAYLGTLKSESDRLAQIVENVLVFARNGAGAPPVDPVDAQTLFGSVIPALEQTAAQAEMKLEIDIEGLDGVRLRADATGLGRVLGNLVDNACKYAQDAEDRCVTLRVRPIGSGVECRVRDRGPGIARADRKRVFRPFTRGGSHDQDGTSGLGLGLALARSVARSLGGELRLAKTPRPGAEFVLWLPSENQPAQG